MVDSFLLISSVTLNIHEEAKNPSLVFLEQPSIVSGRRFLHQHNLASKQEVQPDPWGARLAAVAAATESLLYSPSVEQLQEMSLVDIKRPTLAHRETPARPITAEQKLHVLL